MPGDKPVVARVQVYDATARKGNCITPAYHAGVAVATVISNLVRKVLSRGHSDPQIGTIRYIYSSYVSQRYREEQSLADVDSTRV